MPMEVILINEDERWRRYAIYHRNAFFTGETWTFMPWKALLFADINAARTEVRAAMKSLEKDQD